MKSLVPMNDNQIHLVCPPVVPMPKRQQPLPLGWGRRDGEVFDGACGRRYVKFNGTIRRHNAPAIADSGEERIVENKEKE